jgi:hypothetical protein
MTKKIETNLVKRSRAALDGVQLLDDAGFLISDFDIEGDIQDAEVELTLQLSVPEGEDILDEDDGPTVTVDVEYGQALREGFLHGFMAAQSAPEDASP